MKGALLAELRKNHGMKQRELAELLSVSVTTVSGYENDNNSPSDETKIEIAKTFNVSLDYLMGVIDEQQSLDRSDIIELPRDFPVKAKKSLKEFIRHIDSTTL